MYRKLAIILLVVSQPNLWQYSQPTYTVSAVATCKVKYIWVSSRSNLQGFICGSSRKLQGFICVSSPNLQDFICVSSRFICGSRRIKLQGFICVSSRNLHDFVSFSSRKLHGFICGSMLQPACSDFRQNLFHLWHISSNLLPSVYIAEVPNYTRFDLSFHSCVTDVCNLHSVVTASTTCPHVWQRLQPELSCDSVYNLPSCVTEVATRTQLWQRLQPALMCDRGCNPNSVVTASTTCPHVWQRLQPELSCDSVYNLPSFVTEVATRTQLWQRLQPALMCDRGCNPNSVVTASTTCPHVWQRLQPELSCDSVYNLPSFVTEVATRCFFVEKFPLDVLFVFRDIILGWHTQQHTCHELITAKVTTFYYICGSIRTCRHNLVSEVATRLSPTSNNCAHLPDLRMLTRQLSRDRLLSCRSIALRRHAMTSTVRHVMTSSTACHAMTSTVKT